MYNSERMMKAIGDISDDKIEKASRALGYQKERRQTSRIPIRMGRVLSIAAVVALILALGVTAWNAYEQALLDQHRSEIAYIGN